MANLTQLWLDRCRKNPRAIVLPESSDARTIHAAARLVRENATRTILFVGNRATTMDVAHRELDPDSCRSLDKGAAWTAEALPLLGELTHRVIVENATRRNKPVDMARVATAANDPLHQAGAIVQAGHADCALAGAVATTADVIRAAIATTGIAPGLKTVSGSFIMERPSSDRSPPAAWLYADSGVVIEPDVNQLADIAAASVKTWRDLVPACGFHDSGSEPVVAFLSFSTKGSARHPAAEKMSEAARIFSSRHPEIACDGELQFDAAVDAAIGARKCPSSPAAGKSNIFIFPDLGAGNIAYKITQRVAGFHAYGPILQGLARPYSDLSRGSTPHDIFMSALLNLLRA